MMARRNSGLMMSISGWKRWWFTVCLFSSLMLSVGHAADLVAAQKDFDTGEYTDAIKQAQAGIAEAAGVEEWHLLLAQALLTVGRNADAEAAIRVGMTTFPQSIR